MVQEYNFLIFIKIIELGLIFTVQRKCKNAKPYPKAYNVSCPMVILFIDPLDVQMPMTLRAINLSAPIDQGYFSGPL